MRQAGTSAYPSPPPPSRLPVDTGEGTAGIRVLPASPGTAAGTVLLGHGAGGQRDAADVLALLDLTGDGWTVVLVDQPWRVAGRKVATSPPTLDRAWRDLVAMVGQPAWQEEHGVALPRPWVYGGRSAGARVACRTSVGTDGRTEDGVAAVLTLAFPLHPPGRPDRSRAEELALPVGAGLPTLVVQGRSDPFGTPAEVREAVGGPLVRLEEVPGNHSPSRDLDAVLAHARSFLAALAPAAGG